MLMIPSLIVAGLTYVAIVLVAMIVTLKIATGPLAFDPVRVMDGGPRLVRVRRAHLSVATIMVAFVFLGCTEHVPMQYVAPPVYVSDAGVPSFGDDAQVGSIDPTPPAAPDAHVPSVEHDAGTPPVIVPEDGGSYVPSEPDAGPPPPAMEDASVPEGPIYSDRHRCGYNGTTLGWFYETDDGSEVFLCAARCGVTMRVACDPDASPSGWYAAVGCSGRFIHGVGECQ